MNRPATQHRDAFGQSVFFRRRLAQLVFVLATAAVLALGGACSHHEPEPPRPAITPLLRPPLTPLFDDLERRTFNYFWETANPANGIDPGPLSVHRTVLEHRRDRFRPDRLRHRRRARLRDARSGDRAHAGDAALSRRRTAGFARRRHERLSRILLSLPRSQHRRALRGLGRALVGRHRAAARRRAVRAVVLRPEDAGGNRDPPPRRHDLPPRRMAVDAGARAADLDGLDAEAGLHPIRLAGLQRRHADLRARARLADAGDRHGRMDRLDEELRARVGHVPAAGIPRLRAVVRSSVFARLDRFPRHPGRVHARARLRLFREQPPRDLRAARLRDRQPDGLEALRRKRLGPDRERRAGRHLAGLCRQDTRVPPLLRARRGPRRRVRRRHDRADRRGRVAAVRAGDRDPGDRGNARPARRRRSIRRTASSTRSTRASPTTYRSRPGT